MLPMITAREIRSVLHRLRQREKTLPRFFFRKSVKNQQTTIYVLQTGLHRVNIIFTARCYASAVLAMALCPSVVSVSVSVTSRSSTNADKQTVLVLAWRLASAWSTVCYKEILASPKVLVLPSGKCFLNSGLISPRQVSRVVNETRQRSSLLTTHATIDASRLFTAHRSTVAL